jgi:hypothetical protein
MNIEKLIKQYEARIIKIKECYIYDDADIGKGKIEALEDVIEDLKQLNNSVYKL